MTDHFENLPIDKQNDLVDPCLYNWLGYGNPNGKIWFIGTEEGGAEIWRFKTQTAESSLLIRSNFELQMDFIHVWDELYGIDLSRFKGPTVWKFMAAFILSYENQDVNPESVYKYIFLDKKLGRMDSDHFLGELLPLPKIKKNEIRPYGAIYKNVKDYWKKVLDNRFNIISDTLEKNENVKLIVSYEKDLSKRLIEKFSIDCGKQAIYDESKREQIYTLYTLQFSGRPVFLLTTPFFGQGRISYEGIRFAINHFKHLIK